MIKERLRKLAASILFIAYLSSSAPVFAIAGSIRDDRDRSKDAIERIREKYPLGKSIDAKAEKLIRADEGGELSLGRAKVVIPANALSEDTVVSIEALFSTYSTEADAIDNATSDAECYRFLPSGSFLSDVTVCIPYDKSLNSTRAKLDELASYFYSEEEERWIALERIGIDEENCTLISRTSHFTDIINATLSIPDTAKETEMNLNSIKSLEAAKADGHLLRFNAPNASSTGAATFSFELDIPNGRLGMQPGVAISFSSDGGNGIMGRGFSLIAGGCVSTDTRNGLASYDTKDTYMLDGVLLKETRRSSGYIEYTPLRENAFRRIRRYNPNEPDEYWQVSEKTGLKRTYGSNAFSRTADGGRVFEWYLEKEEDVNSNTVKYEYFTHLGTVYLSRIRYTGHNAEEGRYIVRFNYIDRSDVRVDARSGWIMETAKVLKSIETYYQNEKLKTYSFEYDEKSLSDELMMTSFVVANEDGESYSYDFSYTRPQKDSQDRTIFYSEPREWANARGMENSRSSCAGGGFSASIGGGIGTWGAAVIASGGASASWSSGTSYAEDTLVDIDGDSRPDSVWQDDDGYVFWARNNGSGFDNPKKLMASVFDTDINKDIVSSSTVGWNAYAGAAVDLIVASASAGVSYCEVRQSSTVRTRQSFMDIDGDGRADIVMAGKGWYYKNCGPGSVGGIILKKASITKDNGTEIANISKTHTNGGRERSTTTPTTSRPPSGCGEPPSTAG